MGSDTTPKDYRHLFVGLDQLVPVLNAAPRKYINLDNAASTPALLCVQQAVNEFLSFYSSVHRGSGFKSQLSTHAYEQSREIVLAFVGAHPSEHTCIFVKNTTEALNKLSRRFPFTPQRNVVLTSGMEHHSNDLPWRSAAHTVHVRLTPDGRLDEADFDRLVGKYADKLALVAITGASNVTGNLNSIYRLAEKTHRVGAQIVVDCAQLAPHRRIAMGRLADQSHLDFIAISAHKMYAPFGSGALIGRQDVFEKGSPDTVGGGTVDIVTLDDVVWTEPPGRDEAGSPNTIGAIALAAAIRQLEHIGMEQVATHEAELTAYALKHLSRIPELRVYGNNDPAQAPDRLGVIPFTLEGISHFKVAAILGFEFGIGVRSGCFCAHPYILHLIGIDHQEAQMVRERMQNGDRSDMPGLLRASFGLYNTLTEVDILVDSLTHIIRGEYNGHYVQEIASGEYYPDAWTPDFSGYFNL